MSRFFSESLTDKKSHKLKLQKEERRKKSFKIQKFNVINQDERFPGPAPVPEEKLERYERGDPLLEVKPIFQNMFKQICETLLYSLNYKFIYRTKECTKENEKE